MKRKSTSRNSGTDFARLDAMTDEEIDTSDIPELTPEMFARGIVRRGLEPVAPKAQLTIRVDREVLEWFRQQGSGYQTRINALMRAYMDAHKKSAA
ncbi:MAG TPA: BrnA antitoxin family protein [Thermoanaerobaculia bacterium]|nr:BrnA antitoxin family protein [Thermoanaerobaculia bacterium]